MNLVILCSGNGSNLQALIDAQRAGQLAGAVIRAVVVNNPAAYAITRAQQAQIPVEQLAHQDFQTRTDFDLALIQRIDAYQPDLIVLAGFMRILTSDFVRHYAGKLINIHPSLLPAYKGMHTHQRVLVTGDRQHGCSVHYVTEELDAGTVIAAKSLTVPIGITADQLAARVHVLEHQLLPEVVATLAAAHVAKT